MHLQVLVSSGQRKKLKLLEYESDFGICKVADSSGTLAGVVVAIPKVSRLHQGDYKYGGGH